MDSGDPYAMAGSQYFGGPQPGGFQLPAQQQMQQPQQMGPA